MTATVTADAPTPVSPLAPAPSPPPTIEYVVLRTGLAASLSAAIGALPLLFLIWILALARLSVAIGRKRFGRSLTALAAELGIAPVRLAGLKSDELARLRDKVAFDDLTGVMRRAGGMATLEREVARARRLGTPLSIAFIDVDGLKRVNDNQGHAAGDKLLQDVVLLLSARLRADDAIFRYGGDEFCSVLPNVELPAAARIVEEALATARAWGSAFSVGLAQLETDEDAPSLIARADAELYRRRGGARSRVDYVTAKASVT